MCVHTPHPVGLVVQPDLRFQNATRSIGRPRHCPRIAEQNTPGLAPGGLRDGFGTAGPRADGMTAGTQLLASRGPGVRGGGSAAWRDA
jgi:hypothetical protein